ncbi:hypothetical protein IKG20_00480 [Candidatus Saccharibacteria bacterium]|nr:hypothetical protein [Candidatus Saccharibacteria bacterium]
MEALITVLGSLVLIGVVFATCFELWKNYSEIPDSKTSKDPDDQSGYLDAIENTLLHHNHLPKGENYAKQLILLRDQEYTVEIMKEEINHHVSAIFEPEEAAQVLKQTDAIISLYRKNKKSILEFVSKQEPYNKEKEIWLEGIISDNDVLLSKLRKTCTRLASLTGTTGNVATSIATGVFRRHA